MAEATVYYLEDDPRILELTLYTLAQTGIRAEGFSSAGEFLDACAESVPDLVLLDIMLPDVDGLTVLRRLRGEPATRDVPVMMLTAKGDELDKAYGLDLGADDYLAKPFGMVELLARVRALLRRSQAPARGEATEPDRLSVGGIVLDEGRHTVTADGVPVSLTPKEFDLLKTLMASPGRVLSRDRLLADVWDVAFSGGTRTVDVHVRTLRQKLAAAAPGSERAVETVRGVGYRLGDGHHG